MGSLVYSLFLIAGFLEPFQYCSPVLGMKYSQFQWFVPRTGLQSQMGKKGLLIRIYCLRYTWYLRTWQQQKTGVYIPFKDRYISYSNQANGTPQKPRDWSNGHRLFYTGNDDYQVRIMAGFELCNLFCSPTSISNEYVVCLCFTAAVGRSAALVGPQEN